MTTNNQNFTVTQNDDEFVTFAVVDSGGNPLDISAVTNIEWSVKFDRNTTLTKTFLDGDVTLPNGGSDGLFQVEIDSADTAAWLGLFAHQAVLIDDIGERSTVANGVMTISKDITP